MAHSTRPTVESLEGKLLLSGATTKGALPLHHVVSHPHVAAETSHLVARTHHHATHVKHGHTGTTVVPPTWISPPASTTPVTVSSNPVSTPTPISPTPTPTPITVSPTTPKTPAKPTNTAVVVGGLSITLTTDQSSYKVGQSVKMTYTETNVGSTPVFVTTGPSADGFDVMHNGTTIWSSNSGPEPMFLVRQTIQPGASITFTATWTPTAAGTYTISQQSAPAAVPVATITVS